MAKPNYPLIVLGALVLIFAGNSIAKEAVADIEGQPCVLDTDCPCWGTYNYTEGSSTYQAYGIGTAQCVDCSSELYMDTAACTRFMHPMACDVTWCLDVEESGAWIRDNIWLNLKNNTGLLIIGVLVILMGLLWPKR